jgi:hypothetical protein
MEIFHLKTTRKKIVAIICFIIQKKLRKRERMGCERERKNFEICERERTNV